MNRKSEQSFLERYEFLVPFFLFTIFLAFTLPGISWGAPSIWNPDEIVVRSIKALYGEWKFSEINFNYPDLPQYTMFFLGKAILALGYTEREIIIASRVLSAALAGLTVVFAYRIARRAGAGIYTAGLSGLFLICVTDLSNNGRFAHNDTYSAFFSTLAILFLLVYTKTDRKGLLYASFIAVGMAASSKYIAGSLVLAPLLLYVILQAKNFKKDWFSIGETLFISAALTYLGFAAGTPKALTWMAYFFKRVYAALDWQVAWGRREDSVRGILGQYRLMEESLGLPLYLLFVAAVVWACYRIVRAARERSLNRTSKEGAFAVLLLGILALDLPVMISYNYQPRYLLPFMPMLAVLAAFFVEDLYKRVKQFSSPWLPAAVTAAVVFVVFYSLARLTSVALLFIHDARIPAGEFLLTLPVGSTLEHTNYPPSYPDGYFEREHNYPLHFQMGKNDTAPTDKPYEFNKGEAGLLERQTDYLIVDSFTANKFDDPFFCNQVPVECEFFKQLATGRSEHYELIAEFEYQLPWYLPKVHVTFANPTIRIYQRIK
ncbi:MAG TPA: phospholipid carrier-dependent glycosyltransferase [Anaerolineales bacterium]|nr:phospholipid carrier-dependent glycosyltransferase [Anaerolineales bacterium]